MTKKLPYLTEEELNAPIKAVTIVVYGDCRKRGYTRKEVLSEPYRIDVVVPANYNTGHVRLCTNSALRKEGEINARTHYVDKSIKPKAAEGQYRVRDFMSDEGMRENTSLKTAYDDAQRRKRLGQEQDQGPMIGGVYDTTVYGDDGLPSYSRESYAV